MLLRPERGAELLEASRSFGDGDGEDRLAPVAHLGAFRDEAQPVEIRVRAGGDGDELLSAHSGFFDVGLGTRDRKRAGGLENRARVLEHVLDRAQIWSVSTRITPSRSSCTGGRSLRRPVLRRRHRRKTHVIQHDAPSGLQ